MTSSYSSAPSVSVVVVSHNEGANLRRTVHNLLATAPRDSEIIVVDDGSDDGSADCLTTGYSGVQVVRAKQRLGAIAARDLGAGRTRGDVLVFSDAHVEAPLGWTEPLLNVLSQPEVGAVAPAISVMGRPDAKGFGFRLTDPALNIAWLGPPGPDPTAVPMLGAGFLAMRREVFAAVGGFDTGLQLWGYEDSELCLRLWLLGYECVVVPSVVVAHLFRSAHPYHVAWAPLLHNILRVATIHFNAERIGRVVAAATGNRAFPAAFACLAESDVWQRRDEIRAARLYDDDWFFHHFGMEW